MLQHCFCQHAQDQTRNQSADHQESSNPSLLLKLQTSSMCLNSRWRGFTKRNQETGNIHDRPWSGRPRKTGARDLTACMVRNIVNQKCGGNIHGHISAQKPSRDRNSVFYIQGPCILDRKIGNKPLDQYSVELQRRIYCSDDTWKGPSGPGVHPEDSQMVEVETRSSGYIQLQTPVREIFDTCSRLDSNDTILNINPGSTMTFLRGKTGSRSIKGWLAQTPDINIIEHIWGRMKEEVWRTKPKNLEELWDGCKVAFHAIPDDFRVPSSTTLCQTGWQLFCRPKEPIQDINYLTFSP